LDATSILVCVLNYNGRALLERCLPSVVAAAHRSRHACHVVVVDNASTDDSASFVSASFPRVGWLPQPNHGLASFNYVLARSHAQIALLLNNDICLHPESIDPLVAPLVPGTPQYQSDCFLTAALCRTPDAKQYDGQQTAVRWRWGLVQATAQFPGHDEVFREPSYTASAGAAVAVHRTTFLDLGGFDALYWPGRLEDLDLCYRAYRQGWHARHVPAALAEHVGAATFQQLGPSTNQHLALRNTLLFQWRHLHHPWHIAREALGLTARLCADAACAPFTSCEQRWRTARALGDAIRIWRSRPHLPLRHPRLPQCSERGFFRRFHPSAFVAGKLFLAHEPAATVRRAA